jgi:UDPglucose 6-dehydrogenase
MDIRSAEFTKYAANAMLATRISFMNELSRVAERVGVDIELVRQGMGSDPRIGSHFLYAGIGYGGSCFPKDVKALMRSAAAAGVTTHLLAAVETVNEGQKQVLVDKILQRMGPDLSGFTFALWGLAFKPNTDDMREAPSRILVQELSRRGARVHAYDPVAGRQAKHSLGNIAGFSIAESAESALQGADALLIATEWKEFRTPDFESMRRSLKTPLVFDGRNLYEPSLVAGFGLEYHSIGRPIAGQPD